MDRRNSFECHFCKAFFGTLKELDHHVDSFQDSSDSERESIGNNMIEDVYYSSQESDSDTLTVEESGNEDVSHVDQDDDDEDFDPEDYKPKSKVKRKKVIKKSKLDSRKRENAKQVTWFSIYMSQ